MRLLRIGLLAVLTAGLLAVAVVRGYSEDQAVIRWLPGTGIASKIDVTGTMPSSVIIEDQSSGFLRLADVAADGTLSPALHPATTDCNCRTTCDR